MPNWEEMRFFELANISPSDWKQINKIAFNWKMKIMIFPYFFFILKLPILFFKLQTLGIFNPIQIFIPKISFNIV